MIRRMPRAHATSLLLALALASAGCRKDDPVCGDGQTLCDGVCRDAAYFQSSPDDCGACGVACGLGACAGGACECDAPATLCAQANPRCVDTATDAGNCGGCGVACTKPGAQCQGGTCGCFAPADEDCGTYCADLATDEQNCGACGSACTKPGSQCDGTTPCACLAPRDTDCGTYCADVSGDEQNCGACGRRCPAGATCGGTTPTCRCPSGTTLCADGGGEVCADLQTDEGHCGGCTTSCPSGATCTAGSCACPAGPAMGCGDACCPGGAACCTDGTCPLAHANGLGQTYYDCGALDAWTVEQAGLAARAWYPGGTPGMAAGCPVNCLCMASVGEAAVWCYTGSKDAGLALVTPSPNCLAAWCPSPGNGFDWH